MTVSAGACARGNGRQQDLRGSQDVGNHDMLVGRGLTQTRRADAAPDLFDITTSNCRIIQDIVIQGGTLGCACGCMHALPSDATVDPLDCPGMSKEGLYGSRLQAA